MKIGMTDVRDYVREQSESDAEIQANRRMSRDERSIRAIDRMTSAAIEQARRNGSDVSPDAVRSEIVKLAEKSDRER